MPLLTYLKVCGSGRPLDVRKPDALSPSAADAQVRPTQDLDCVSFRAQAERALFPRHHDRKEAA